MEPIISRPFSLAGGIEQLRLSPDFEPLTFEPRVSFQQDQRGTVGAEVSVAAFTQNATGAHIRLGLNWGFFYPNGTTYLLGEFGISSASARFRVETSLVNGVDFDGNLLLGWGASVSYFPLNPGRGLNFSAGIRALGDLDQGQVRGVFQLGLGYVPDWSIR